uniref:Major facilitator superfamily (MFS) profile domain-containing protein n=1 Tax=Psilocybe cubensis TaxID=181762 RepID=A0A8H7Y6V0_PSICU
MAGGPAVASDGAGYRQFITDTRPWYKNKRIIALNLCICLLLITSSTNGYDGSMMNGLQSVTAWEDEFHTPHGGKLGLFNAIQNIGSLAAYPFAPYFADGFGRRPTIFFGACIMVAATILQTAAHSFGMFIGARFLIGFGLTFAAAAAPLLVTEIAYPTQRAQATSMYNTLWYLGSIIAAWTTFGTFRINNNWAWRIPSALQGLPSVLQIFLIWLVPESPRFLVSKGREAEALKTLAYYHANSNQNDPLVQYEFEEIKAAIAFDRDVAANVGWLSLFKSAGNRRRMRIIIAIAFFSQWSGNGLVSYYLNKVFISIGITDNSTQLLINGILNIWNFIIAIGAGFLCERVGRRRLFMTSTIGMLIFWTLQSVCVSLYAQDNNRKGAAHTVIAMIFLFYGFYDVLPSPLLLYTVEILPYSLRAKGFTIFNFSISLSLIFNQYVNPIALAHLGWKYYMVYVAWIAFEVVFCYFFIIETKGLSLEETAALFDGDETVNMITGTAHVGTTGEKDIDNDSNEKISDTRIE